MGFRSYRVTHGLSKFPVQLGMVFFQTLCIFLKFTNPLSHAGS
jgi:hypothetical protein